jgi:hypothetical protein
MEVESSEFSLLFHKESEPKGSIGRHRIEEVIGNQKYLWE